MNKASLFFVGCSIIAGLASCTNNQEKKAAKAEKPSVARDSLQQYVHSRIRIYEPVKLTTNLNALTANQRKVLPLLIQAAGIMDDLFWKQTYPQRDSLLTATRDEKTKAFIKINYGPWDRLNGDKPFISGVGSRPGGATFYPAGMIKSQLEKSDLKDKFNPYSERFGGKIFYCSLSYSICSRITKGCFFIKTGSAACRRSRFQEIS